jgi:hypothetical protein
MSLYSDEEHIDVESLTSIVHNLWTTNTDDEEHVGVESLISIVHDLWSTNTNDNE